MFMCNDCGIAGISFFVTCDSFSRFGEGQAKCSLDGDIRCAGRLSLSLLSEITQNW